MHETLRQDTVYVAVDLLILTERDGCLRLLLSRRTQVPFAGIWALPGRFVGPEESAEAAVHQLVLQMLGVRRMYMEQLYTFSELNRDPRGRVISIAYLIIVPWPDVETMLQEKDCIFHSFEIKVGSEHLALRGSDGRILTGTDLAFDHGRMIETGIRRIQGKLDYTPIAFAFLRNPEAFSLSEVQTVYEAILGHPLDPSNFRRQILNQYETKGILEQTQKTDSRGRGRPAVLYRWNDRRQSI